MKKNYLILALIFGLSAYSAPSFAWGERGHHLLCDVAVSLVKEKGLRSYLVGKGHTMGHLCNIPDTYWKSLSNKEKARDTSHYIQFEVLKPLKVAEVPTDFQKVVELSGMTPQVLAASLGTAWWRTDQFFRRSVEFGKRVGAMKQPTDPKDQKDAEHVYNIAVLDLITNLGLMGHYVADLTQPYHNTTDHDGWDTGHGGIHVFYESLAVDVFPHDFEHDVFLKALSMQTNSAFVDVLSDVKNLSITALNELPLVLEQDKLVCESDKAIGKRAVRRDVELAAEDFKPLVTTQLARGAATLARFWDAAYVASGRPEMPSYYPNRYPLTPDFVPLDYIE